jgi:hypothetical protein
MAEALISGTVKMFSACYPWEINAIAISYHYLFRVEGAGFIVSLHLFFFSFLLQENFKVAL